MKKYNNWIIFDFNEEKPELKPLEQEIKMTSEELFDYPFLSEVIDDNDVYCIWLGGSSFSQICDEYSDYDLCVLTEDRKELPLRSLRFKNRHAHFLFTPLKNHLQKEGPGSCFTQSFMNQKHLLWVNDKYKDIVEKWCHIDFIRPYTISKLFLFLKEEIDFFLKNHFMPENWRRRSFVTVVEMICYLQNKDALQYKDFLCTLKRSRWKKELTPEQYEQLYTFVKDFHDEVKDWDHEKIIKETEEYWKEYWKDLE